MITAFVRAAVKVCCEPAEEPRFCLKIPQLAANRPRRPRWVCGKALALQRESPGSTKARPPCRLSCMWHGDQEVEASCPHSRGLQENQDRESHSKRERGSSLRAEFLFGFTFLYLSEFFLLQNNVRFTKICKDRAKSSQGPFPVSLV